MLQLRSSERRGSETPLFFLSDAGDLPNGFLDRGQDALRFRFVRHFNVFTFVLDELGFKRGRFSRAQKRMNGPVFPGDERANFLFALDDQPECDGLHAAGRKTAADLVPQERRDFVTHNAIENAPGLLRIHQIRIHF